MIERFLKYSLERERKICVVLMDEGGAMIKKNMQVTSMDDDGFTALLPGRKRESRSALSQVLTAAYARGDQGELE